MNYYDKINWKNRSEGKTTKISAERLNHMDNQIFNNANAIGNVEKIADIGDGTLCGAAETLKETAEKLTQSLAQQKELLSCTNVRKMNFGYYNGGYYIEFFFAEDNKYRIVATINDISLTYWNGTSWATLWKK